MAPLAEAFQALEQGDWPRAETLCQQLATSTKRLVRSQAYTGLAAVAFAQHDYQRAPGFVEQAETLEPEIAYSHVVRGHVLWNQGKLAEAAVAYQTATKKQHATPWQRAMAYNRLGQTYAAQGNAPEALAQYDKAVGERQDLAVVYANKGYLLAQLGKHQEALEAYRQALQLNPDDALTTTLFREAQRREQLALDKEKQERIGRLVAELLQTHKEGRQPSSPSDDWTSPPLTLAVMAMQMQGTLSPRAGEPEFLWLRLT